MITIILAFWGLIGFVWYVKSPHLHCIYSNRKDLFYMFICGPVTWFFGLMVIALIAAEKFEQRKN